MFSIKIKSKDGSEHQLNEETLNDIVLDDKIDTAIAIGNFVVTNVAQYGVSQVVSKIVDGFAKAEPKKWKRFIYRFGGYAMSLAVNAKVEEEFEKTSGYLRTGIKALKYVKEINDIKNIAIQEVNDGTAETKTAGE